MILPSRALLCKSFLINLKLNAIYRQKIISYRKVKIKDKKIENYQCVVPGTWNGSPRDASDQRGPYESALIGTPVADPEKPVEILRTIHSFDPCMACAVHVVDPDGNEITRIKVV